MSYVTHEVHAPSKYYVQYRQVQFSNHEVLNCSVHDSEQV